MNNYDQFVRSILGPSSAGGYNVFNTLLLGGIAFFVLLKIMWPILKKNKVNVDFKLVLATIPYLLFGTIIRAFEDFGALPYSFNPLEIGFYTHTPGLWIMIASLIIISLLLIKKKFDKIEKNFVTPYGIFGLSLFSISLFLFFLNLKQAFPFIIGIVFILAVSLIGILIGNRFVSGFKGQKLNYLAVLGQGIDGSSTYIGTTIFSCVEQHFVSMAIIDFFPFLFIAIKIAVVIVIVYYLDKEIKDQNYKNYLKSTVIALGFMTGTRNLWSIGLGVCG